MDPQRLWVIEDDVRLLGGGSGGNGGGSGRRIGTGFGSAINGGAATSLQLMYHFWGKRDSGLIRSCRHPEDAHDLAEEEEDDDGSEPDAPDQLSAYDEVRHFGNLNMFHACREKRRRHEKRVCVRCKAGKTFCDDARPCKRCIRLGHEKDCVDAPTKVPRPRGPGKATSTK